MRKSKLSFFFLLCLTAVALLGCGGEEKKSSDEHLNAVIKNLFQSIDEAEYEQTESSEAIPEWVAERFETHFTKEGYEKFTSTATYQILLIAYENEKTMEIKDLSIEEKDGYYDLSWTVETEGGDAEAQSLDMTAGAQLDKDGRVSHLEINQMSDLNTILEG